MTSKLLCSIFTLLILMTTGHSAQAEGTLLSAKETVIEKENYLYPGNKEKIFTETIDQFYEALRNRSYPVHQEFYKKHYAFYKKHKNRFGSMDSALFKDMPDASVNFRKKMLFQDVEKYYYITWDGNGMLTSYPDLQVKVHQAISPNRQVYFFYIFKDTEKQFRGRCSVYDVETKQLVAGGEVTINRKMP